MPVDDYDADATELLETYGACISRSPEVLSLKIYCVDFLMKYIVIGLPFIRYHRRKW